jgi:small redox-active disulfide protein 2
MKKVLVFGPGCRRCQATADLIAERAAAQGVAVEIVKITDYAAIARAGVVATPGVAIDGKLVHSGGLPQAGAIDAWLRG